MLQQIAQRTGAQDIVIGVPVNARARAEWEAMPGNFLNVVPFRARAVTDGAKFVHETHASWMRALDHRAYPFRSMLDDIAYKADLTRAPIFDVTLTFAGASSGHGDAFLHAIHVDKGTAKYDASYFVYERPRGLELVLEYSTSLLSASEARSLLERYAAALEAPIAAEVAR